MTEPLFPTLTNSRPFASFPFEQEEDYGYLSTEFENGFQELAAQQELPTRRFVYASNCLSETDVGKVMGFLRERGSGGQGFYITNPGNVIWSPWDAPTLSQSSGGALAERTYYVRFSWGDGTNQTLCNQYGEGSKVVSASYYLTVTVPAFPKGVTQANIYISTSAGTEKYSALATTSCGTWTQDSASTTVDVESASGQKILKTTATTNFQVGNTVVVNDGGAHDAVYVIASISAGDSLTMTTNLTYTHAIGEVVATTVGEGAAMPTTNAMSSEEIYVRLVGPAKPVLVGRAWALSLTLEELK
jgi:hypothetical protein